AAGTGFFTFALVTVLTRGLGPASYGAFVSAQGIFTILSNTAELGADTGLVRTVARLRALDRVRDIRKTLYVGLIPPLLVATLFSVAMWAWAPQLAHIFGKGRGSDQIVEFVRWMAPFVPAGGVVLVLLSATRGFGTMIPTVTVDRLGRPFVQFAVALGIILLSTPHHANHGLIALSWAVPQLIGAVIGMWWLWGLLLKAERRDRRLNGRRRSRPTTVWPRSSGASPLPAAWPASSRSSCCGSTRCSSGAWGPPPRPASSTPPPATSPPASWSAWPSSTSSGPSCPSSWPSGPGTGPGACTR